MNQPHPRPERPCPVLGFAAYSGTGKTTLLERLIPLLGQRGLRLGVIKLAHHRFDLDTPGKDSYRLRKAGATRTLVASPWRWVLITETPAGDAPDIDRLLQTIGRDQLDLILVEGARAHPLPKIELHRPSLGHPAIWPQDPRVIAVATDAPERIDTELPLLDLDDPAAIARFISDYFDLGGARPGHPTED